VKSTVEAVLHSDEQSVTQSTNHVLTAVADNTAAQPVGRSAHLPGQMLREVRSVPARLAR